MANFSDGTMVLSDFFYDNTMVLLKSKDPIRLTTPWRKIQVIDFAPCFFSHGEDWALLE